MLQPVQSVKKVIWTNAIFFFVTTLLGVFGTSPYLPPFGVSLSEALLFLFYTVATGTSITLGYHRLFAHNVFKANVLVRFLVLFFGAAAFEQSALRWASQHRDHHRFVDTDRDPYSIKNSNKLSSNGSTQIASRPSVNFNKRLPNGNQSIYNSRFKTDPIKE